MNYHSGLENRSSDINPDSVNYHSGMDNKNNNYHSGLIDTVQKTSQPVKNNFHAGHKSNPGQGNNSVIKKEVPRGNVTTTLTFYVPPADGSKPYNFVEKPQSGPSYNFGGITYPVSLVDVRGSESSYTLEQHSFATIKNLSFPDPRTFATDESIEQFYYPELERVLLATLPSAKKVFLFDHTVRRPGANRAPVHRVHIDQTPESAIARVYRHLPAEATSLLAGRVRLINFWRPLNGTVVNHPLAFADSSTVPDTDLVDVEHRYPDWTGATLGVKYSEGQKWYYWSGMTDNEALMLQCYDSESGARVPHSAFTDPRTGAGWKARESIEIRALIFG